MRAEVTARREAPAQTSAVASTVSRRPALRLTSAAPAALLPHEIAWAALFVVVGARLVAAGVFTWVTVLWLTLALTAAIPVVAARRAPSLARWRVRLLAWLVVMNAAYALMGAVVRATGSTLHDALLQRLDTLLFGAPLPLYLDRLGAHPLLTDLLSGCYFVLYPYIAISCLRHAHRAGRDLAVAQAFYAGLFTVYAVGMLGYLLVPARGAYLDMPGAFHHALAGGWMTRLNDAVVHRGSNGVDVFPSLHVAVSTFILFFDRRHAPWRFRLYLLPAIGLWVSTVALRYHYGVDVLAGFALAFYGLRVAGRECGGEASRSLPNE